MIFLVFLGGGLIGFLLACFGVGLSIQKKGYNSIAEIPPTKKRGGS